MKLSTTAKGVLTIVAVAGAYRLYKIWKTGNAIAYSVKGVKFKRLDGRFAVVVDFDIFNPTSTSIGLKKVTGKLASANFVLSNFTSGAFEIKPGHNIVPIIFYLDSLNVVKFIANAITLKKFPIFNVETTSHLALFNYTDRFAINTADYASDIQSIVFSEK